MEMEKTMQIIHSPEALHSVCAEWRRQGLKTALVPTMGYYHAGHASLISYARSVADKVIVSLFVNPTQFGPNEDLEAYPRDFEKDSALVRELGGDVLYAPEPENMYAPDHATWVEVPALANTLCGLSRPIHFRGVCTVVLKLFMLAQPSLAVFGEKDWQQLAIIKKMVSDLNVPVEVVGRPIVREADGLALSSRNVYLTPEERAQAPQIRKSLEMAAGLAAGGERDAARIIEAVRGYLAEHLPTGEEDYISVVDPAVLTKVDRIEDMALCALAIRLGKARLIDNILLKVGDMTLAENMMLKTSFDRTWTRHGFLNRKKLYDHTRKAIEDFEIKAPGPDAQIRGLSGGNQQKVILAREVGNAGEMLVMDQPTRGLDLGAINNIHTSILEERRKGKGILLVSTELSEIFELCDRIAVIYKGAFMGIYRHDELTTERIGLLMAGYKEGKEA